MRDLHIFTRLTKLGKKGGIFTKFPRRRGISQRRITTSLLVKDDCRLFACSPYFCSWEFSRARGREFRRFKSRARSLFAVPDFPRVKGLAGARDSRLGS